MASAWLTESTYREGPAAPQVSGGTKPPLCRLSRPAYLLYKVTDSIVRSSRGTISSRCSWTVRRWSCARRVPRRNNSDNSLSQSLEGEPHMVHLLNHRV